MQNEDLAALIARVSEKTGVAWYEWCDVEGELVKGLTRSGYLGRWQDWLTCPPAVQAAIIAWTHEVAAAMSREREWCSISIHADHKKREWMYDLWYTKEDGTYGVSDSHYGACVAALEAIGKGLTE